jgi:hypothetical protein
MENLGYFKPVNADILFCRIGETKRTNVMIQEHLKLSARNATMQER